MHPGALTASIAWTLQDIFVYALLSCISKHGTGLASSNLVYLLCLQFVDTSSVQHSSVGIAWFT